MRGQPMDMEMVLSTEVLRMFKHLSLFTYPYISMITTSKRKNTAEHFVMPYCDE
jgi:hypothetical protein